MQEDNQLRRLVDEHGHRKWSFIASKMNGRRGKQCRDRWLNHLKPDIRRGEWTQEEERILVEQAYDHCFKTLSDNRELMEVVVDRLVESETVDAGEFQQMVIAHTSSEKYLAGAAAL